MKTRVIMGLIFSLILVNLIASNLYGGHDHGSHEGHDHAKHEPVQQEEIPAQGRNDKDAHDDHAGENKNHFELTKNIIKNLKLKTERPKVFDKLLYKIPKSSLVKYKDKTGVYVKNEGEFKMLEVDLVGYGEFFALIKSKEIKLNMKIVKVGVPMLRVAHLQASGEGGHGHVH